MSITIDPAKPEDVPVLNALYEEAVRWLGEKGTDQWQPAVMSSIRKPGAPDRSLSHAISRGEVFLVRDNGSVVGSVSLDGYADPQFWTDDDHPDEALYLHRMIVSRAASGRGLGAQILDWAADQAARAGLRWIRLDAWRSNPTLADYYKEQGFTHVRTESAPLRKSGALFQREVRRRSAE